MIAIRKLSNTLESIIKESKENVTEICSFVRNQLNLDNDIESDDEKSDSISRKISTSMNRDQSPGTFAI